MSGWHFITKNHANQRPSMFVFVDVETWQNQKSGATDYTEHTLRLGVACAVEWRKGRLLKEKWYTFITADEFWAWLPGWQNKRRTLWVVAHNAAFDLSLLGLWKLLANKTYTTTRPGKPYRDPRTKQMRQSADWHGLTAIDGRPFHLETEGPRGRVNFTDLQNYYQCALAEIAPTVGLIKGDWQECQESDAQLAAYCRNDVEILKRAYMGLVSRWEREGNGNWKFSAAGLAWSNYRHKYMSAEICVHDHAMAMDLEWYCLFGGELRCFYRGKVNKPVSVYDVNSLYPYVMRNHDYPTCLIDLVVKPVNRMADELLKRYLCCARVTLFTPKGLYPVLHAGKTVYPVGRFEANLCGMELVAAHRRGHIETVHELACYTYEKIFTRYVDYWWAEKAKCKREGDTAGEKFAKLMLNSLPAKFAQRTAVWVDNPDVTVVEPFRCFPHRDPKTEHIYHARSLGYVGQTLQYRKPTEHTFPAIYAHVTSYAREYMRVIRSCIKSAEVYYQDTDSLIVSADPLVEEDLGEWHYGDGLGQMRLVGTYASAEFRGPKNYTLGDKHVIAGVKAKDKLVGDMLWSGERFETTRHLFNRPVDATLRSYHVSLETPGSDSEGGYDAHGWALPLEIPRKTHQ